MSPLYHAAWGKFVGDEHADFVMSNRPSLMGAHTGPAIADAGLQARVLDTILINATAIFDED